MHTLIGHMGGSNQMLTLINLLRMARMEMDWNLKKLGQRQFQVLMLSQQKKYPKTYYGLVFLKNISLDFHLAVYQEYFVHK